MVITFSILLFAASLGSLDIALYGKVGQPKGQCVEGSGNPAGCDAATHVATLHALSQLQCRQPDRGRVGWDGINRPIPVTVEVVRWAAAVLHGACPNYAVLMHQATLQSMTDPLLHMP